MTEIDKKIKMIDEYCLSKKGCIYEYQNEWQASKYLLFDKMFLMQGMNNKHRPIITIKLDPMQGAFLRETYQDKIIAGYYMNKIHWNTIYLDSDIDIDLIKGLINESYQLIFDGLTKKKQKEIEEK